ncbi:hypothetical protein [Streptomyces sp. NPDC026092]|uniref:hypothetical protein n=1 Tax=Streptomyces sp. NPDC026092 TaxID=3154797 RepID=UPI0033D5829E
MAEVSTINVSPSTAHAVYRPGAPLVEMGPSGVLRIRAALPVSDRPASRYAVTGCSWWEGLSEA